MNITIHWQRWLCVVAVAGLVLTRMTTKFLNKKVCMRYQVAERFVVDQQNNLLIRYLLLSSPGDGGDAGGCKLSLAPRHIKYLTAM